MKTQRILGLSLCFGLFAISTPTWAEIDWWDAPTPGYVRIFYDFAQPDTVHTIPIDGIDWSTISGGGGEEVVGSLYTSCNGDVSQTGRIYPHTHYSEMFVEPC